jgi:hypothetical protein
LLIASLPSAACDHFPIGVGFDEAPEPGTHHIVVVCNKDA